MCVCLRSIPYFFSVEDCQGLTPYNNPHTLRSDEPRGEGNMMSPPTNNNHPASPLTSTSPGFLATPQLSPSRAHPPQPLLFCKPFAFPCQCNGSNHQSRISTLKRICPRTGSISKTENDDITFTYDALLSWTLNVIQDKPTRGC